MTSHIERMLRICFDLLRITRYTPKLLSLVVVSMIGLSGAQPAADPTPDEAETTERTIAYRHYL